MGTGMSYGGRSWSAIDLHRGRDMNSYEGRDRGQQTWAGAARDVWRAAARHKLAPGLIALAAVASLIAIALVASGPATPAGAVADPAAQAFVPAGPRPVGAEDLAQRVAANRSS